MKTTLKGICNWLEETKGITEIEMSELVEFYPEYVEWLKENKNMKVQCTISSKSGSKVEYLKEDGSWTEKGDEAKTFDLKNVSLDLHKATMSKEEKIYEGWLLEYKDDISILFAESGADRELGFDREKEDERLYEMFHTDVNKFLKLIGRQ